MISNARAYQHIQAQADQQERLNAELRLQRDESRTLNQALEEANRVRSEFPLDDVTRIAYPVGLHYWF